MPRVTPIASKADLASEHQAVADDVLGVFGAIRGPFSMMLHSPEMTKDTLSVDDPKPTYSIYRQSGLRFVSFPSK